jgi:hypothetical protein
MGWFSKKGNRISNEKAEDKYKALEFQAKNIRKLKTEQSKYAQNVATRETFNPRIARRELRQQVKLEKYKIAQERRAFADKYRAVTPSERAGQSFIRGRKNMLIINRDFNRPIIGSGRKKEGRGRPRGTYDQRYAQYGGVYGYRKILAARLRNQGAQAQLNSQLTPQEQQILAQMRARQGYVNPESQAIADTRGRVPLGSYHQEADDAANLFP